MLFIGAQLVNNLTMLAIFHDAHMDEFTTNLNDVRERGKDSLHNMLYIGSLRTSIWKQTKDDQTVSYWGISLVPGRQIHLHCHRVPPLADLERNND